MSRTTKETRQKLIKQVGSECESQKGKLRNVRKKYMDKIRVIEKSKTVSKDDVEKMKKKVDMITDSIVKEMTEMMKKKEQELDIWLGERIFPPFRTLLTPPILSTIFFIKTRCLLLSRLNSHVRRYAYRYSHVFVYLLQTMHYH